MLSTNGQIIQSTIRQRNQTTLLTRSTTNTWNISIFSATRKMQTETTLRFSFILVRMVITKKQTNQQTKNKLLGCIGKTGCIYHWWGLVQPLWNQCGGSPETNIRTTTLSSYIISGFIHQRIKCNIQQISVHLCFMAIFIISKSWHQSSCLPMDKEIVMNRM